MTTLTKASVFMVIAFAVAQVARPSEVWIVRGLGGTGGCNGVGWSADALLHNRSSADATVRTLHVSNGGAVSLMNSAVVFANSSVSLAETDTGGGANAALWVTKLDLPTAVAAEGRLEIWASSCAQGQPPPLMPAGKISLPVFTQLIPANEEQVHFGTDLGGKIVRLNIAIFNAGTVPASATITVVQPVCGRVPTTMSGTVAADSIVQLNVPRVERCVPTRGAGPFWASYVTVTVDQPSFSFVSTLDNDALPSVAAAVTP